MTTFNNYDKAELNKFTDFAPHWWDLSGPVKTLHQINPLRLKYIETHVPLKGKNVLDIGCGGGILTESMASKEAFVTGIDLNKELIEVAKLHQLETGTQVSYFCTQVEEWAKSNEEAYEVITCLELLEHVPYPKHLIENISRMLKPGGKVFFSTINRNLKAYIFAILGAEYILKLLPKNTHDYEKFIRPSELDTWLREVSLTLKDMKGITYNPFTQAFSITDDIKVNYLLYAIKT